MKFRLSPAVCLLGCFAVLAVGAFVASVSAHQASGIITQEKKDLIETASAAGSFSTLAKALEAAELTETLKGAGPFTVFAPTDEAFAKLPPDKLEALLQDKELLKKVLLAHVVSGRVMAKDVAGMKTAKTLAGSQVAIRAASNKVMIGNASITQTDIAASNVIIHVIDSVILPAR